MAESSAYRWLRRLARPWSAWMPGSARRCSTSACPATRPSTASNTSTSGSDTRSAGLRWERGPARRVRLLLVALLRCLLCGGVALLEPGHAPTGVEDLLLAGVEGVALRADVGVDGATTDGAAGRERVAAGAGDLGLVVLGVGVLLHGFLSRVSVAGSSPCGDVNRNQPSSVPGVVIRTPAGAA